MTKDRRLSKRLQLTLSVAKPIKIEMHSEHYNGNIPAILVNLSASGMALVAFHEIPLSSKVEFELNFMGLNEKLKGSIVRKEKKFKDTYVVGIQFEKPSAEFKKIINKMAEDNNICEITDI